MLKYCFLDTNILIHFQTFDEVDWCSGLGANEVVLVLAPVIMRELNQHKDNSSNEWRQKRSRKLLTKLKALLKGTRPGNTIPMKKAVSILEVLREPIAEWSNLGLDPQVNDDRLLATIIEFANTQPPDSVILISDDFPLQRKAAIYGIQVVEPEGILQRIERPSSQASKIEALQRELDTLRSQFAKLELGFWEKGKITNKVARSVSTPKLDWPSNDAITKAVGEKRQRLEEIVNQANSVGVKEKDIEDFVTEYRKYTEKLERALIWQRSCEFGPSCDLTFIMRNSGSVPAVDIEVDIYFPINSFVIGVSKSDSNFLDKVWIPPEPKPAWEKVTGFLSSHVIPPSPSNHLREPTPRGPLYDFDNRHMVTYEHPKLRHKSDWIMPSIRVYLDPTTEGGFQIKYSVEADNIADPIKGNLNVVLATG